MSLCFVILWEIYLICATAAFQRRTRIKCEMLAERVCIYAIACRQNDISECKMQALLLLQSPYGDTPLYERRKY